MLGTTGIIATEKIIGCAVFVTAPADTLGMAWLHGEWLGHGIRAFFVRNVWLCILT